MNLEPDINLAVVNTLFHPDKGGATIVCSNLYQNLSARFKVSFFNGRFDDKNPYLHSNSYDTGRIHGISVNLVNLFPPDISSWIDGTLKENYHNPSINPLFERFLEQQHPQVVHFHSLQWLGAQLIPISKDFGAKTVITMHDWWWICPRQFLVKQDGSYCSHTNFQESCDCMDQEMLVKRTEFLQECLNNVDNIIVPSRTLKESLLKSGFIKQPISVIENGIVSPGYTPVNRGHRRDPVTFSYLGTDSWLKGCVVLTEAALLLEKENFRLKMHGFPLPVSLPQTPLPVLAWKAFCHPLKALKKILKIIGNKSSQKRNIPRTSYHPIFDNDELDTILTDTDIVIIPSLQRESFSLVAREAMIRNIPVLSSDCGGPMEIIEDGVNGLIFPTGDARSLADCMKRIIHDRSLLEHLRAGIDKGKIPLLSDQVSKTESFYMKLLHG